MGNKNNKIGKIYTEDEVLKAIEIWYNINQVKIKESKRKSWNLLTEKEKFKLTKQFRKLDKKVMVKFLDLSRNFIKTKFRNKVKTTPFFEYMDTPTTELTNTEIEPKKLKF